LATRGQRAEARRIYGTIGETVTDPPFKARLLTDLAVLDAADGDFTAAVTGFEQALALDPNCQTARGNLTLLQDDLHFFRARAEQMGVKVAVVSLLYNWPSSGGGNIHTAELVRFLANA